MDIFPLDTAGFFDRRNVNDVKRSPFKTLGLNAKFQDAKKGVFCFSKRYEEIKQYNPEKSSIAQLFLLDDDEYNTIIKVVRENPKRKNALLSKKSQMSFKKTKYTFNDITDKKLGLSFSDGLGFYNVTTTSNEYGDLFTLRETSGINKRSTTNFADKSRFNRNYIVENAYRETLDLSDGCKIAKTRKVSIKDRNFNPILDYAYAKKYTNNSDCTELNINGRVYKIKTNKDGKVIITSGTKGEVLDFSKAIKKYAGNDREKDAFVSALKLLPPQILLELNETLDNLSSNNGSNNNGLCLYNSIVAANSMIDLTVKRLCDKHSLDCDEKLKEIFQTEKGNFLKWLDEDSDGRIRKSAEMYKKNNLDSEDEIFEVIKSVCQLLWMEEYEEGKSNDEGKRLLLNFFPKTVNFIVSCFELNTARCAA